MGPIITSPYGKIYISKEVFARIAQIAATESYGLAGMAGTSIRQGIVEIFGLATGGKGVVASVEDGELIIELHVIVSYGTRIPAVGQNIIDNVCYTIEQLTGIKPGKVNLIVRAVRVEQ